MEASHRLVERRAARAALIPLLLLALGVGCGSSARDGNGSGGDSDRDDSAAVDGGTGDNGDDGSGNDGDNVCQSIELVAAPVPPRVMILQDLSSSLANNDRWNNLRPAMIEVVDTFESKFALGLVPFATTILDGGTNDSDCTVNTDHVIPPGPGNGTAIKNKVYQITNDDDLVGGTPTHDALIAARDVLVDQDPGDGSARIIILVTDGAPNCKDGTGNSSGSDADKEWVTEAVTSLHDDDDITTYVVGYDLSGSLESIMNTWASIGGTGSHFPADDTDSLIAQMSTIGTELIPCEYALDAEVADASYVSVKIDGVAKAFGDTSDGWTLGSDNKSITLEGDACTTLRDGDSHDLDVVVECEPVIVE